MDKFKQVLIILTALSILTSSCLFYQNQNLQKKISQLSIQPSPSPTSFPETPSADPTTDWKLYQGKYFSFKHPQNWTNNTSNNLEVIGLRISPNALFETSYKNYSYEKGVQSFADRKSSKLTISNKEATRFEMTGSGDILPRNSSIISFVVKGIGDTSYSIVFNGDQKDITEQLINQILSTFQFLD
ncbi:hypothetical protein COW80_01090 [Candidatus Beckwithbacteria bacterium CG22_combo_CG10-13_8_21_14_all_01_47_9]|uniref:Uncharacterized protein n=2 Tax=Candidatus Beckwithiibacteriota TaxID=1752726 RepID=A0A2H0E229_9BACT|nr:MAG: hypothetical protein COW80_01090 [Candidatus Beckwithbacteria bacterium CG22_combo_CG10-13_8_21_14_all_01_47_9]PJC66609.1 MAG: hypothetical protein CO018_01000 [Candidatus Beckwithbacteria bacterium CG_4_9_14_0_2_um_filter_47_11]